MYYIMVDCGTTNSRAYVIDTEGKVYATAKKQVGVKDTSITGSRDTLRAGLQEIAKEAVKRAGIEKKDVAAILSSGMITSEIGLMEIPHTVAPSGIEELADTIVKVEDANILDDTPVFFVRGIRNVVPETDEQATIRVGSTDLMRGEETQIIGMLSKEKLELPVMVVGLSSHTKFMPVDKDGKILGSLTTISGQLFDAILNGTFLHKSAVQGEEDEPMPENYFDEQIVEDAIYWIDKVGLSRASMYIRLMDVFMKNKWYERLFFLDALVAAEDLKTINQVDIFDCEDITRFHLVGAKERCELYKYILKKNIPGAVITSQSDSEALDFYSISGMLQIAKKAGIV